MNRRFVQTIVSALLLVVPACGGSSTGSSPASSTDSTGSTSRITIEPAPTRPVDSNVDVITSDSAPTDETADSLTDSGVDPDEATDPTAAGARPPSVQIPTSALTSSACRSGDPLANVYHPYRLTVIKACLTVSGTVSAVRHEPDGDDHVNLMLDPAFASLINSHNVSGEHGALVVEIVPADKPGCTPGRPPKTASGTYNYGICTGAGVVAPRVGDHISVTGPYVIDTAHGWMEIHPVWATSQSGVPTSIGTLPGNGGGVTTTTSGVRTVSPGAYCSPIGAYGTYNGKTYVCSTTSATGTPYAGGRAHWRRA